MQGIFAESSLRKQAWRNPKEGRVGCLHQNIFTRKVTDIAFTSDFFNNHYRPRVPCVPVFEVSASPSHTCPRPILDVLKSLVSRPQVPSPHTRVPMSPSPCPRPTFIHSQLRFSFFFNHSVVFTCSKVINQHFGVIEFVDQHILEKL